MNMFAMVSMRSVILHSHHDGLNSFGFISLLMFVCVVSMITEVFMVFMVVLTMAGYLMNLWLDMLYYMSKDIQPCNEHQNQPHPEVYNCPTASVNR